MPRLGGLLQCLRTWKRKTDSGTGDSRRHEASCGTGRCSGQTERKYSLGSVAHAWEARCCFDMWGFSEFFPHQLV